MVAEVSAAASAAVVTAVATGVRSLLDKFFEDKDEANRLSNEIATLSVRQAQEVQLAQIEVNKEAAKNTNWFVAGARPSILWICAVALFNNYILVPWGNAILMWNNVTYTISVANEAGQMVDVTKLAQVPSLSIAELMPLLFGLLGLGAYRSFEKVKGVARSP